MKRMLVILLVWAIGTIGLAVPSQAKPAYCFKALIGCFGDCSHIYSSDKTQAFCNSGCYLGYLFC